MEEEGIGRRKKVVEVRGLRMMKRRRSKKVGEEVDGGKGRGSVGRRMFSRLEDGEGGV